MWKTILLLLGKKSRWDFLCKIMSLCDDGNSMGTHSTTELDGIDFPFIINREMNKMWVMKLHKLWLLPNFINK